MTANRYIFVMAGNVPDHIYAPLSILVAGITLNFIFFVELAVVNVFFAAIFSIPGFAIGFATLPVFYYFGAGYNPPALTPSLIPNEKKTTTWNYHIGAAAFYAYCCALYAFAFLGLASDVLPATTQQRVGIFAGIVVATAFYVGQVAHSVRGDYEIPITTHVAWVLFALLLVLPAYLWSFFLPGVD